MSANLVNNSVSKVQQNKNENVEGFPLTIRVTSSRVLISRMKFQKAGDDQDSGGSDVVSGPIVLDFDSNFLNAVLDTTLPAGTYNRVKLEKHKFSASEADDYVNDIIFGEFAAPERLTAIIEGFVEEGRTEQAFKIEDNQTENIWIDLDQSINADNGGSVSLELQFDATAAFKSGSRVLNPLDEKDEKEILKNLKHAFKIQNSD